MIVGAVFSVTVSVGPVERNLIVLVLLLEAFSFSFAFCFVYALLS